MPTAHAILLKVASLLVVSAAWAETPYTARGRATGPDGEALPGARAELLPVLSNFEWGRRVVSGRGPGGEPVREPAARAVLDAEGRFSLSAPRPGVWEVVVRAEGYVPMRYTPLPLLDRRELPPIALLPDAGAEVQVHWAAGGPAAGVWVFADSASRTLWRRHGDLGWTVAPRIGRSGAAGAVELPRAAGEMLALFAVLPGWSDRIRRECQGRATLRLPSAERLRRLTVEVSDAAGGPVAGALISAGSLPWPVGLTDAAGRLRLPQRLSEPLPLHVFAADGRRGRGLLEPPQEALEENTVRVEIAAHGTLAGQVLEAAGREPIAGALIWPGHDPGAFTLSDEDGVWSLVSGLPEGDFWIQAEATGFLPRVRTMALLHLRRGRAPSFVLQSSARLAGRTVDVGGQPLAGVHVAVRPQAPTRRPEAFRTDPALDRAVSDAEGRFELVGLEPDGGFELLATRAGHAPATAGVPRLRAAAEVLLTLEKGRSVTGRIVDPGGNAVAGATVRLRAADPGFAEMLRSPLGGTAGDPFSALTGDAGRFVVAAVPGTRFEVSVARRGFAPLVLRGVDAQGGRVTDEGLPAGGAPIDLGDLVLTPGAAIAGRVTDGRGTALSGVRIWLESDAGTPPPARPGRLPRRRPDAVSGRGGRFQIGDLAPGRRFHLVAGRAGRVAASIAGVEAPTRKLLAVVLEAAAEVSGRVTDAEGRPVPEAEVTLAPKPPEVGVAGESGLGPEHGRRASSGEDGRFAIADVTPGLFEIAARAEGFRPSAGRVLAVEAGRPAAGLEIVLERGARLRGQVMAEDGMPVTGARVLAGSAAARSDADGFYLVDGLASGPEEVRVDHPDFDPLEQALAIAEGDNEAHFVLRGGWSVRGRVEDEAGGPLAGVSVLLRRLATGARREYRSPTGSDGRFEIPRAANGRYTVHAEAPGFASPEEGSTLAVEGAPVEDVLLRLRRGSVVRGRVLGLDHEDLARVRVEARSEVWSGRAGRVDFAGAYEVAGLGPGDWWIEARVPGTGRRIRARASLEPGQARLGLDLEFRPGLTLSGHLRFDAVPAAGARLRLTGGAGAPAVETVADHAGAFRFEGLARGSYRLAAVLPSAGLYEDRDVELFGDLELTVEVRTVEASGRVIDARTSEPLADTLVVLRKLAGDERTTGSGTTVATDARGRFRVRRMSEGPYQVSLTRRGYLPQEHRLEALAGSGPVELEYALEPTEGLEAVVRLDSGRAADLATLAAEGTAETQVLDGEGRGIFYNVPPGTSEVLVSAPGGASRRFTVTRPDAPLAVVLPAAAVLTVRVPELFEFPDVPASLTVLGRDGRPLEVLETTGAVRRQWPLDGGAARIEGVPAGAWTVAVEAADGRSWTGSTVTTGSDDAELCLPSCP